MSIDPKILKRMQGEDTFLQSQTRGSRRVKLNRGQNWIVRFLPAQMGPDGLFFARIARHWLNKLPIICPRNTAEDFGGSPDCECPICALAEELNESPDEIISKFGYKAKANPQFLTYCLVWEKDGVQQSMSEIINPYEFWHYRSTWEELKGFYVAGGRKCADSVLDYQLGNDFSVNKTAKGMRLDKLDAGPIFDQKEPKYAEWIKKIEAAMKTPKVTIPTHEQMQIFAAKVQEAADRGGVPGDDDSPRGRRRPAGGDDESDFRPRRRPAAAEEPEDDIPYDTPPARPAARAAAAPAARRAAPEPEAAEAPEEPAPRRRPAPVDDDPQPPRRGAAPAEEEAPAPRRRAAEPVDEAPRRRAAEPVEEEEVAAPRRAAAPTARRSMAAEEPEPEAHEQEPEPEAEDVPPARATTRTAAPTGRTLPPTARRAAGATEAAASAPQGEAEEEDPLPEDDSDPVPAAPKRGVARAAAENGDDAPPPVARQGGAGSAIAARLAKLPPRA